jgi:hypothetical protein
MIEQISREDYIDFKFSSEISLTFIENPFNIATIYLL